MEEKLEEIEETKEEEKPSQKEEFVEISNEEAREAEELNSKYAKFASGVDYYLVFADKAPLGKIQKQDYDDPELLVETIVRRVTVIARGPSLTELTECNQTWDIHQKGMKETLLDYVEAETLGKWIWKYKKTGSGLATKHKLIALKQRGG